MNQLKVFEATIAHEKHDSFLFYASFSPKLDRELRNKLNLSKNINLKKHFGMYTPIEVNMKLIDNKQFPDFGFFFRDRYTSRSIYK